MLALARKLWTKALEGRRTWILGAAVAEPELLGGGGGCAGELRASDSWVMSAGVL
jgi:hypothetical protein